MQLLKRGTIVVHSSFGSSYKGFIIGTCSYDGAAEDNGYVVRYLAAIGEDLPWRGFGIVAVDKVGVPAVADLPKWKGFLVGDHWSATPHDRCEKWKVIIVDGYLTVIPEMP